MFDRCCDVAETFRVHHLLNLRLIPHQQCSRGKCSQDGRPETDVGEPAEELATRAAVWGEVCASSRVAHLHISDSLQVTDRFGGAGGGAPAPRAAIGGAAGLLILVGGVWAVNNALFNGKIPPFLETCHLSTYTN